MKIEKRKIDNKDFVVITNDDGDIIEKREYKRDGFNLVKAKEKFNEDKSILENTRKTPLTKVTEVIKIFSQTKISKRKTKSGKINIKTDVEVYDKKDRPGKRQYYVEGIVNVGNKNIKIFARSFQASANEVLPRTKSKASLEVMKKQAFDNFFARIGNLLGDSYDSETGKQFKDKIVNIKHGIVYYEERKGNERNKISKTN